MMMWVYGAVIMALVALAAEMFARYRKEAVELTAAERASRAKVDKHAEAGAKLRVEIPEIEAHILQLTQERTALEKDLNWERQNYDELFKRNELRHAGRHPVDRDEDEE